MTQNNSPRSELISQLAEYAYDPLGFVLWAFPWGEGELAKHNGPCQWQIDLLKDLRDGVVTFSEAVRLATTSGHGIGKSAMVAWLILWGMATYTDCVGVVTANTENQLKTKTWVQLAKWHRLFIAKELFKLTATALFSSDPEHAKTWRFDMVPWSERNTEAFAGLHNQGKRILIIFDEASNIPDVVWEVTEGALSDADTEIIWAVFGNPTINKGRFRECFAGGKFEHRWQSRAVNSASVPFTNKKQIKQWIADYGDDHDFVRIRILGKFPRVDASSFISREETLLAVQRAIEPQKHCPLILGVDVGRFGNDPSVIYPRQGRDACSFPVELFLGLDTMRLAGKIVETFARLAADIIMVDGTGVGGGVVDRLRQLRLPVIDVQFGNAADGYNTVNPGIKYANKRAEIWGAVKDFLPTGAIIQGIPGAEYSLTEELAGPSFGLTGKLQAIQLETKESMRRRGVASPNVADALACTFAFPEANIKKHHVPLRTQKTPDYNPYAPERMYQ